MQEDKQMIVYKRGKEIILKSVALALVVITFGVIGYKTSEYFKVMEEEQINVKIALKEYQTKIELAKMTEQYKIFQEELEKKIEEAEVTKKVVTPSAVTYVEEKSSTHTVQSPISYEKNVPEEYKAVYEVKATAYCLCKKCCGKSPDNPKYGETSSGLKIIPGTGMKVIAVDPNLIPLGSKVYVEGLNGAGDYGYAIAADKGSAIKNYKIDLYMDSHQDALNWGRKTVKVYVIE